MEDRLKNGDRELAVEQDSTKEMDTLITELSSGRTIKQKAEAAEQLMAIRQNDERALAALSWHLTNPQVHLRIRLAIAKGVSEQSDLVIIARTSQILVDGSENLRLRRTAMKSLERVQHPFSLAAFIEVERREGAEGDELHKTSLYAFRRLTKRMAESSLAGEQKLTPDRIALLVEIAKAEEITTATRRKAIKALRGVSDDKTLEALNEIYSNGNSPVGLRREIVLAFRESSNPNTAEFLRKGAGAEFEKDERVKVASIRALEKKRDPETFGLLESTLQSPFSPVASRVAAARSLAKFHTPESVRVLSAYARRRQYRGSHVENEDVRRAASKALCSISFVALKGKNAELRDAFNDALPSLSQYSRDFFDWQVLKVLRKAGHRGLFPALFKWVRVLPPEEGAAVLDFAVDAYKKADRLGGAVKFLEETIRYTRIARSYGIIPGAIAHLSNLALDHDISEVIPELERALILEDGVSASMSFQLLRKLEIDRAFEYTHAKYERATGPYARVGYLKDLRFASINREDKQGELAQIARAAAFDVSRHEAERAQGLMILGDLGACTVREGAVLLLDESNKVRHAASTVLDRITEEAKRTDPNAKEKNKTEIAGCMKDQLRKGFNMRAIRILNDMGYADSLYLAVSYLYRSATLSSEPVEPATMEERIRIAEQRREAGETAQYLLTEDQRLDLLSFIGNEFTPDNPDVWNEETRTFVERVFIDVLLTSSNERLRTNSAHYLLVHKTQESIRALESAFLNDSSQCVRNVARESLRGMGIEEEDVLIGEFSRTEKKDVPSRVAALEDLAGFLKNGHDETARRKVVAVFGEVITNQELTIVKIEAAKLLAETRDPLGLQMLLSNLHDPHADNVGAAIKGLGITTLPEAIPEILSARCDRNGLRTVARTAVESISQRIAGRVAEENLPEAHRCLDVLSARGARRMIPGFGGRQQKAAGRLRELVKLNHARGAV